MNGFPATPEVLPAQQPSWPLSHGYCLVSFHRQSEALEHVLSISHQPMLHVRQQ